MATSETPTVVSSCENAPCLGRQFNKDNVCTYKFNFPDSALLGDLMYFETIQLTNVTAHVGLGDNLMAPDVVKCSSLNEKSLLVV